MGNTVDKQKKNRGKVENLIPFTKGVSGNPNGRPKKEHGLTDLLRKALDEPHDETGITNKQMVIDKMFELANKGDAIILKYLFDRIDGKPLQTIENTNFNHDENDMSQYTDKELRQLKAIHKKHA